MTMSISRRRFLRGTAAGLGAFAISGSTPFRPAAPAFAAEMAPAVMQLGWIANVEYMGMFIADDAGYYADEGLGMSIEPGGPAISVAPIVASGKALVGLDSTDTIARARAEGAKLKVIGAELQRNPTSVMSLASNPIKTPQDLVGKKFGVQQNGYQIIQAFLKTNNVDPKDVTIVPVQFDPAPLVNGEVDAFMSFLTNQPIQLDLKGIANTNFLLSDFGYVEWADCLIVTEDSLADPTKRKQLVGIVRGTVRGWQDAVADPSKGATLAVEKYGKAFNLDQHTQDLIAAKLVPLVATPETEKNGLFTMSQAGIDANIAAIRAVGVETTAEDLFDTSVLEEAFGGKTRL
jgi:ABC-type nitrate/sulfonate/bicarbonate transport system substrate-binding protein